MSYPGDRYCARLYLVCERNSVDLHFGARPGGEVDSLLIRL
jgi:hypothetical protein